MIVGLGLGHTILNFFLIQVGKTFNTAAQTFIGHAYGMKELRMCAVYQNKAIFLTTIMVILISFPLIFTE